MATGRLGTTPVLRTRWSKEPAGGTTSLSGLDDYSVSLVYEVGYEAVYQNGALLSRGNDYTATDGTTITLTNATVAGDIIEVFANNVVPLTDTYSQSVADGKFVNNTIVDAKGDLIVGSAADTFVRLPVGSANQVLTVDSATTSGLKWAAPASGLTLISRVDFSNVATQDFDNVFTSTYRTYMIVFEKIFGATTTDDGHLQLRSSGPTTKTSGYYQQSFKWTGTINSTSSGGGSEFAWADDMGTTTDYVSGVIWVNGVGNTNEQCNIRMQMSNSWGSYLYEGTGACTSGTFTGFRLKSSSGNITGRVAVYGMAV